MTAIALPPTAISVLHASAWQVGNFAFAGTVVMSSILTRTFRQTVTPIELLPRVAAAVLSPIVVWCSPIRRMRELTTG